MERHYTGEELELYRNREMSVLGRIACSAHLRNCPECAGRLKALEEDDELIRRLRGSLKISAELAEPDVKAGNGIAKRRSK